MHRVATLSNACELAPPTAELCLIAGMIISQTKGKPEKVRRLVTDMKDFVSAHAEMAHVIRLRGAEHDGEVLDAMNRASAWLDRIEPFLLMMARR